MSLRGSGCGQCGGSGRVHIGGGVSDACPGCFGPSKVDLEYELVRLKKDFVACRDALACAFNNVSPNISYEAYSWLEDALDKATKLADNMAREPDKRAGPAR